MDGLGIGILVFGYALLWTGIQGFNGNHTSVLASLGLSGGLNFSGKSPTDAASSGGNTTSSGPTNSSPDPTSNGGTVTV